MTFPLALHLAAVVLAGLALALHPGLRRRSSRGDLAAGALMTAAMGEAMWVRTVPVVYSVGALMLCAIVVAGTRRLRLPPDVRDSTGGCERAHTPLGLVVTAACLPFMHPVGGAVSAAPPAAGHGDHGASGPMLVALVLALGTAYLVISIVGARRAASAPVRNQFLLMGASAALMAVASIG